MKNLLNQLTIATEELKADYLEATKQFSKKQFEKAVSIRNASSEELKAMFSFENDSRVVGCKVRKLQADSYNIVYKGLAALVEKDLKNATKHFENSLVKLEARIIKKGLELDGLILDSGYIDKNFNCLITDVNGKKVKAQTILAWGAIQKPHYRYLVK